MDRCNLWLKNVAEFTRNALCLSSHSLQHATVIHFNEDNDDNKTHFEKHTMRQTICNGFPLIFHNCIYESIFTNECILLIFIYLFRYSEASAQHELIKIVRQTPVSAHKFQMRFHEIVFFSSSLIFYMHHVCCAFSLQFRTLRLSFANRFDELDWLKRC